MAAVAAGFVVDRAWRLDDRGRGSDGDRGALPPRDGELPQRPGARASAITWLRPTQTSRGLVVLALLVMLGALVVGAVRARRGEGSTGPVVVAGTVAAVAAVVALVADPTNIVPGLLVAFPLAAVGLLALGRRSFSTPTATLACATFALFALAVIATQYRTGGTGEWGGRYFALGLPALVPVLVLALRRPGPDAGPRRPPGRRRVPGRVLGRPVDHGRGRTSVGQRRFGPPGIVGGGRLRRPGWPPPRARSRSS